MSALAFTLLWFGLGAVCGALIAIPIAYGRGQDATNAQWLDTEARAWAAKKYAGFPKLEEIITP